MNSANIAAAVPATSREVWDGFDVRFLRSNAVEVGVVPELGARVVSLKNLRTGRQWMYHANGRARLFRNAPGDDFARSPLVGWDECLPTVIPCVWRGRSLPDHGEVWSAVWALDEGAWEAGVIKTSVRLPVSPFEFTRAIELEDDSLKVAYRLINLTDEPQEYLWVMHPLLALHEGDRLVLSREIREHLRHQPWLESLEFLNQDVSCVKVFAGPLRQGRAEVLNVNSGDRLVVTWNAEDCPMLGIWLTRGGWNGHHHLALEPANGGHDSLAAVVAEGKDGCRLSAGGEKRWSVEFRLPMGERGN